MEMREAVKDKLERFAFMKLTIKRENLDPELTFVCVHAFPLKEKLKPAAMDET